MRASTARERRAFADFRRIRAAAGGRVPCSGRVFGAMWAYFGEQADREGKGLPIEEPDEYSRRLQIDQLLTGKAELLDGQTMHYAPAAVGQEPPEDRAPGMLIDTQLYRGLVRINPAKRPAIVFALRYFYAWIPQTVEPADPVRGYAYPPMQTCTPEGCTGTDPNIGKIGAPWIELLVQRGYVLMVDMASVQRAFDAPYFSGLRERIRFVASKSPQLVAALCQPQPGTGATWSKVKSPYAVLDGHQYLIDKAGFVLTKTPYRQLEPLLKEEERIGEQLDAEVTERDPKVVAGTVAAVVVVGVVFAAVAASALREAA